MSDAADPSTTGPPGRGLNVLSLFDGHACLMAALESIGVAVDTYGAVESDPAAIAIAVANWGTRVTHVRHDFDANTRCRGGNRRRLPQAKFDSERSGDVTLVTRKDLTRVFGRKRIDLVAGGPPCQDFSGANGRRGSAGGTATYSGLELMRATCRAIKLVEKHNAAIQKGAPHIVVENVSSMRTTDRMQVTTLLRLDLVHVEAGLLGASRRPRLYWTTLPVKEVDEATARAAPSLRDKLPAGWSTPYAKALTVRASQTTIGLGEVEKLLFRPPCRGKNNNRRGYTPLCRNNAAKDSPTAWTSPSVALLEDLMGLTPGYVTGPVAEGIVSEAQARHALGNGFSIQAMAHVLAHLSPSA